MQELENDEYESALVNVPAAELFESALAYVLAEPYVSALAYVSVEPYGSAPSYL